MISPGNTLGDFYLLKTEHSFEARHRYLMVF